MGTKTITPRTNNDGQIGSDSKYWDKGYFNTLHVNNLYTSTTGLTADTITITDGGLIFEGSGVDDFETTLAVTNPTADRTITFPDTAGTVALTSGVGVTTLNGTTSNGVCTYASSGTIDVETTLSYTSNTLTDSGALTIAGTGDMTLDSSADIELNADGGDINFKDASAQLAKISTLGLDFSDNTGAVIKFEGATANSNYTIFTCVDPTDGRWINLPDASGTIALTGGFSRTFTKTGNTDGTFEGDIIYIDAATATTVVGKIYYFNSSGSWTIANADAEVDASGMLAVALGDNPDVDGMLLRGMVTLVDILGTTEDEGKLLFLSTTDGVGTVDKPTGSTEFVRVLGYVLDNTYDQVWFNPDNTYIELA